MFARLAICLLITSTAGFDLVKTQAPKIDIVRIGEQDLTTEYEYKAGVVSASGNLKLFLGVRSPEAPMGFGEDPDPRA